MTECNVLIGCTGSVASIKTPLITSKLKHIDCNINVKVVATERALHFFKPDDVCAPVLQDKDEWEWAGRDDPVLHIELRKWADIMVIAPLDANTLAKIASGICDNLLTCVIRAWDMEKPLLFAPAMNTFMYNHPFTSKHIQILKDLGYTEIPSIAKTLVCGDTGMGAMAEVDTIVSQVMSTISEINKSKS